MKILEQFTNEIRDNWKDESDYLKNEYKNHEGFFKKPFNI